VSPWWLRPPADEDPPKGEKQEKPAKSQSSTKSDKPKKTGPPPAKRAGSRTSKPSETKAQEKGDGGQRRSGRQRSSSRRRRPLAKGPDQLALLCDVESIAMAMRSANVEDLDLELLFSQLGKRGQIACKKAYGDWQRLNDLEDDFRSAGLELIDTAVSGQSVSASVSIRLALDAMELCYSSKAPGTFVIFSAETDLAPLVQKLKGAGKQVLGLGIHDTVLPVLAEECDEFIFLNELAPAQEAAEESEEIDASKAPLFSALVEIIESLGEEGGEVIWGSRLKREMRRRQPEFDAGSLGYSTFSEFLEDADRHQVIRLERDDRSGSYYVAGSPRQ